MIKTWLFDGTWLDLNGKSAVNSSYKRFDLNVNLDHSSKNRYLNLKWITKWWKLWISKTWGVKKLTKFKIVNDNYTFRALFQKLLMLSDSEASMDRTFH
jgi:hypothetical protein